MNISDPLILRSDVVLVPVATLPAELRERFTYDEGDYTLSRQHGRMTSQVIDGETASLLSLFRTPRTIVEAVLANSRALKKDPEAWLDELMPHLGTFLKNQVLVPAGEEEEKEIAPTLSSGDRIGEWEVVHCVSLIEDSEIYRLHGAAGDAALKISRHRTSFEQSLFGNELAVLDRIGGAPAAALHDHGMHDGRPYLVIEWCAGTDAATAAAHQRHARLSLLDLSCGIAEAYATLHDRGVVHGDVHPRNIFVADDGSIRLIDFGLGVVTGEPPRVPRGGIYYFFEPEYVAAQRQGTDLAASRAGEQYAVAALIYSLLTGSNYLDFRIERDEMMRQIESEPPLPFSKRALPPWPRVEAILGRALAKDPEARFEDMHAFAAALREARAEAEAELLATPLSDAAKGFVDNIVRTFARNGEMFANGFTEAPTASINFGSAGAAVGLLRIAEARSDAGVLALADVWRSRASRELGLPSAYYNESIDLKASMIGEVTPYHTASGIHAAAALIAYGRGDTLARRSAIADFLRACARPCENVDLTLGRSGVLLAAAMLLEVCHDLAESAELLRLGNDTIETVWRQLDDHPPIPADSPDAYLGMAHGWCGFVYAALRWCAAAGTPAPSALPRRIEELISLGVRRGAGRSWRRQAGGHPHDVTSGWCNGTAGYVFLFTAAFDSFRDDRFLQLAREAAIHSSDDQFYNADLCCGSAGRAYAMLNLYRHTGEREWLSRARVLANHAAAYDGDVVRKNSLWKGEMGVACLIADLQSPENARMPFFE